MAIESKMHRPMSFGQGDGSGGARRSVWPWVISVALLMVVGCLLWQRWLVGPRPNPNAYQAVFLDNGQTYFGKLSRGFGDTIRLESVYYFDFQPAAAVDPSADMKLLRLGSEVHAPESYMDINTEHILYTEDLRADSKVAKAITESLATQTP